MVISFSIKKAREQLLRKGIVYTFRWRERIQLGNDWCNAHRNGTKIADIFIEFVKQIDAHHELKPFLDTSGFDTLEEWRSEIVKQMPTQYKLRGYLYRVTLRQPIKEIPKNKHGINGIEMYCRKCGALIAEDVGVMTPEAFKFKNGDKCEQCGEPFSGHYTLKASGARVSK